MSSFSISPQKVNPNVQEMFRVSSKLKSCGTDVDNVRNSLHFSSAVNASISKNLKTISDDLKRESIICNRMADVLSVSVRYYSNTEKSIVAGAGGKRRGPASKKKPGIDLNNPWQKGIYKTIIAALGPFGQIADAAVRTVRGEYDQAISSLVKLAGGIAKNFKGSHTDWAKWFGLTPSADGPWTSAVNKFFDFSSVGKGISSACQWAAVLITTGYSNFKEHGGLTGRFWGETFTESLIKVGETIAITAGVGAIAVAAGVSAPAVAVAAVAAGVTVAVDAGLDAVTKWVTHGSQTSWIEATSDWIIDKAIPSVKDHFVKRGGNCKWGFLVI